MQCTATSKRSGVRCNNPAVTGRTTCRMHGGTVPAGIASPAYRHGRYASSLPTGILDRYKEAASDPDLLDLGAEIALIGARIGDVLAGLDDQAPRATWELLAKAWKKYRTAPDGVTSAQALAQVEQLISDGLDQAQAWQEIVDLVDARRRLVESDRRRLVELQQHMTYEQAMTLVAFLSDSIKRHVTDPQQLAAIGADFALAIGRRTAHSTDADERGAGMVPTTRTATGRL